MKHYEPRHFNLALAKRKLEWSDFKHTFYQGYCLAVFFLLLAWRWLS